MAEYVATAAQTVNVGNPLIFNASIPCRRGLVYHENETGIFTLRGSRIGSCQPFARYKVTYNGNIAVPTAGTLGPIAVAVSENGEPRPGSVSIYTPTVVNSYGNVTSVAIVDVPQGLSTFISVRAVPGDATATTTAILAQNSNLTIERVA